MLRLHPLIVPGEPSLALRHARSRQGVDVELRLQVDGDLEAGSAGLRSGPGWFALDMPGQYQLAATASHRAAHYRLQGPSASGPVLGLAWLDFEQAQAGELDVARGRRSISGHFSGRGGESLFLVVRFSRAFRQANRLPDGSLEIVFDPRPEPLEFALALSTVDVNGARANLGSQGVPDFADVQRQARDEWNALLGRLSLSGDESIRRRAYTAMYRLLSAYGDITDSDGQYRSAGGDVRRAPPRQAYLGNLAPAQRYRTAVPMLSLVAPDRMADLFATITAHQQATGALPGQTVWGRARPSHAPDLAIPVIASLVNRGLPGIQAPRALPPILKASLPGGPGLPWADYERLGYFAFNVMPDGSVSRSLEVSLLDHATASVAAQLGERELAQSFAVRMLFYRQLFDPAQNFFRGRDDQRNWRMPFSPANGGPGSEDYDNRDPWAALWSVAQFDIDGLLVLLGGREALTRRLDDFVDLARASGRMDPAGLPADWHVPWLYPFSNLPRRGQLLSTALFNSPPPADMTEDRAAWELFTLLGFYPVIPSLGEYVLGIPQVASASLQIGEQQLFIDAPGLLKSGPGNATGASFDGARLPGYSVSHRRLAGGGSLVFLIPEAEAMAGQ
jgi:predicted alpha-1,2-mannosidase